MESEWNRLPLLPLRCIYEHLSLEDALAAMSTCKQWRSAMLLYEGHRNILSLKMSNLEKCMFLSRIFCSHTKKLHIYIKSMLELERCVQHILPLFYNKSKLEELLIIGPSFTKQDEYRTLVIKRFLPENICFESFRCLKTLAFLGCEVKYIFNVNNKIDNHSKQNTNEILNTPAVMLPKRLNEMSLFRSLKHIIVDHDQINTESLLRLSSLDHFHCLSLVIRNKKNFTFKPIDWVGLHRHFKKGLDVAVNIIELPSYKINAVKDNILTEGLPLVSLKVMFCKNFNAELLYHVGHNYKLSLREVVWADAPCDTNDVNRRCNKISRRNMWVNENSNVNPFILMCWQCVHLQRIILYGYWMCQYDLLGLFRLRKTLTEVEVPALYSAPENVLGRSGVEFYTTIRVFTSDQPEEVPNKFINEINEVSEFAWKPKKWDAIHPAMRAPSYAEHRAQYIAMEVTQPFGIT